MSRILPVLLLLLVPTAAPGAAESRNPSPEGLQLEEIYLGQSFADVDRLLDIRSYTPLESDKGKHYTWVPPRDPHDRITFHDPVAGLPLHLQGNIDTDLYRGRSLLKIDLVFRDKRVSEVRASYASAALFTRMDLEERYGEPSSVVAPPPRIVPLPGKAGERGLFLQIWTWQWDDVTLTVTGEHYRAPGKGMVSVTRKHLDIFRFHLKAADDSSSRP